MTAHGSKYELRTVIWIHGFSNRLIYTASLNSNFEDFVADTEFVLKLLHNYIFHVDAFSRIAKIDIWLEKYL